MAAFRPASRYRPPPTIRRYARTRSRSIRPISILALRHGRGRPARSERLAPLRNATKGRLTIDLARGRLSGIARLAAKSLFLPAPGPTFAVEAKAGSASG